MTRAVTAASAVLAFLPASVYANCTTTGVSTVCDTTNPSPWTSTIGTGPTTPSGSTITLDPNAQLVTGNAPAISIGQNSTISLGAGSLVQNTPSTNPGNYNKGANTIEMLSGNTLTIGQGATVYSVGSATTSEPWRGEPINTLGANNTIINNGTIRATNSTAIWFDNVLDNGQITTGPNTVVNNATGVIIAPDTIPLADGSSVQGSVIGGGPDPIDFTNRGKVIGNLVFMGGDDALHIYTGSSVTGVIDGGGGNNLVTLNGTGADSMTATFTNFQTLYKQDSGTWTLTGPLTGPTLTEVQQGVLVLNGDNSGYTGKMIVDQPGTLQANAQSLPNAITDNGLVQVTQPTDAAYAGLITGTGALLKDGAGALTFNGTQPYSGGTTVNAGTLIVGDATHAGASLSGGGPVTVNAGGTLGGYGSVTGNVTNNGTIGVANALAQLATGPTGNFSVNGNLTNAGVVNLGGARIGNTLTVTGNYLGSNGTIAINSQLGGDNSPTDKVVLNGGTASGTTNLKVTNVGGGGALTSGNGIQVVQAANGATTAVGAFKQGASVDAGAYTYTLYRGGLNGNDPDSWYLRSQLIGPVKPDIVPDPPVPTYRIEVPIYAEVAALAREMGVQQIGTFHDRLGSQTLLSETGPVPAAWGRVWGNHAVLGSEGTVNQSFDGSIIGGQVGQDLYADRTESGHRNHYGFFLGFTRASGDVSGFALGQQGLPVGNLSINSYSAGGYWSHIGPSGWYTDTVLMGSTMTIDPKSNNNVGATTHGTSLTASVEAGAPVPFSPSLMFEPQIQLIFQHTNINDLNDGTSSVSFGNANSVIGRVGARLYGTFTAAGQVWEPYARVNVLHYFGGSDTVSFGNSASVSSDQNATLGHVGVGVSTRVNKLVSVYASAGYWFNLSGAHQRMVGGNAGVRVSF
ncbi:autotransporter family protein [Burkholderia alba]|uniref:autotransporter family protein n=1 Tax=Burkholderia alba TaxID=2683677 RepID=UPI002B0575E7|nr:autotransporter outer membrane beta-barrel domain-containing protein [Burkholderia alba]